jgi:hypothetical protein
MEHNSSKQANSNQGNTADKFVVDDILDQLKKTSASNKDKSHQFFRDTRVDSCSHVVVKNGVAQAVPFRPSKAKEEPMKLTFSNSLSQYVQEIIINT